MKTLSLYAAGVSNVRSLPKAFRGTGRVLHLCIDVQKHYWTLRAPWRDAARKNILYLIRGLRQRDVDTAYIAYLDDKEPLSKGLDCLGNLTRYERELFTQDRRRINFRLSKESLVAIKRSFSAAAEPGILNYLIQNGYTTLLLSGFMEHVSIMDPMRAGWRGGTKAFCLSASAREFRRAGFEVIIVDETTNRAFAPLTLRKQIHAVMGVKVRPIHSVFRALGAPRAGAGLFSV